MNPGLKQGAGFFFPLRLKGPLLCLLKWEGAIRLEKLEKASLSGERPQSLMCEKRRR